MKLKRMLPLFLLCIASLMSCSDDEGLYFTQDIIVEGDINTGKQERLTNNTLSIGGGASVNVQGAKGDIAVTSSDEKVATVSCYNSQTRHTVYVTAVSIGQTKITVTDSEGNSAQFLVVVNSHSSTLTVIITKPKQCEVKGVSSADSATIAADAIAKDNDYIYSFGMHHSFGLANITTVRIYDKAQKLLAEGGMQGFPLENTAEAHCQFTDEASNIVHTFDFYSEKQCITKDVSADYQTQYPNVSVILTLPWETVIRE